MTPWRSGEPRRTRVSCAVDAPRTAATSDWSPSQIRYAAPRAAARGRRLGRDQQRRDAGARGDRPCELAADDAGRRQQAGAAAADERVANRGRRVGTRVMITTTETATNASSSCTRGTLPTPGGENSRIPAPRLRRPDAVPPPTFAAGGRGGAGRRPRRGGPSSRVRARLAEDPPGEPLGVGGDDEVLIEAGWLTQTSGWGGCTSSQ